MPLEMPVLVLHILHQVRVAVAVQVRVGVGGQMDDTALGRSHPGT